MCSRKLLDALELKGCSSARRALLPPWRYNFAASQDMIFHLLSSGGGQDYLITAP
jgi:hypothetical protein